MSRLPSLPPSSLTKQQSILYGELSATAEKYFGNKFVTKTSQGQLVGPFEIYMHAPSLAGAFQEIVAGFGQLTAVPARQKEVAILVVGAHFRAKYELYAHTRVALLSTDLSGDEISQIKEGIKPASFGADDNLAYDMAKSLVASPGSLSSMLYGEAEATFGIEGVKTIVHLIAFYASICILLNAFDVEVPE